MYDPHHPLLEKHLYEIHIAIIRKDAEILCQNIEEKNVPLKTYAAISQNREQANHSESGDKINVVKCRKTKERTT